MPFIVVWISLSLIGFYELPVRQQTLASLETVSAAVLGGPLTGIARAIAD